MASAAVAEAPISKIEQASSPSPDAHRREYTITDAVRAKLANDAIPPLRLYRSLPDEFVSSENPQEAAGGLAKPQHGLDPASWAHYHKFLESDRATRATKASGVQFKLIHLLRHAQGIHNQAEERVGTEQWDAVESLKPEYLDPKLTEKGEQQCAEFAQRLPRAMEQGLSPQLVLVSPFQRTLQTAELCLDALPGSAAPWVALEHARETIGEQECDHRRTVTPEIEAQHPRVQFQLLLEREDTQWTAPHRETDEELLLRCARLVDVIFSLPEQRVLVVCHAGIINILSRLLGRPLSDRSVFDSEQAQAQQAETDPAPSHTLEDVKRMFEEDKTLEVEGIRSTNCQLLTFCVARLPPNAPKQKS